jgi:hypothetical protein
MIDDAVAKIGECIQTGGISSRAAQREKVKLDLGGQMAECRIAVFRSLDILAA